MRNLSALVEALYAAGLYDDERHPEPSELADALWLASYITPTSAVEETAQGERLKPGEVPPQHEPDTEPPTPEASAAQSLAASADSADAALHIRTPTQEADTQPSDEQPFGSRPFRAPAPLMLPNALDIGRSLRPLLRHVGSRSRLVVDEEATVHNFAELGVPLPVLQGAPERWLELALVVDSHDSLVLWEPLLIELRRLLEQHGAFRDLRLWRLGQDRSGATRVWPGLHGGTASSPRILRDPEGRRAVLVFGDYTAAAWRSGAYLDALRGLSRHQPLALLHLLPQRLWRRTGLAGGQFVEVEGTGVPAAANQKLRIADADLAEHGASPASWRGSLKLPLLTLTPSGVRTWARLLAGRGESRMAAVLYPARWQPPEPLSAGREAREPDARLRLRRFRAGASPAAMELARCFAAVPLTLPVARLVQETLSSDSQPANLAEVFLSGLLEKADHQVIAAPAPLEIVYDFHEGVRQLLLGELTPPGLLDVLRRVSRQVEERLGHPHDFLARIADPTVFDPDALLAPDSQPFAHVKLQVLRRLGGDYGRWAGRLKDMLEAGTVESGSRVSSDRPEPAQPSEPTPFRDLLKDSPDPGPEMLWLPGGAFRMGDGQGIGEEWERPVHDVALSHFAVGKYPITVGEFRRFVEATGYKTDAERGDGAWVWDRGDAGNKEDASWRKPHMEQDDRHPVVCISWNDAKAYCDWLGKETGRTYGLLTEAQWEYACRAGSEMAYCFGDDETGLEAYAWYGDSSASGSTHAVGGKEPNAWQLYDMHGNVWEWCADWFSKDFYQRLASGTGESAGNAAADASGAPVDASSTANGAGRDPSGPESGSDRVMRGGSWNLDAGNCRSACRDYWLPGYRINNVGFRLSRTGPWPSYALALARQRAQEHAEEAKAAPEPKTAFAPYQGFRDALSGGGEAPEMVYLPGGTFQMGDESGLHHEQPVHAVRLEAFAIGRTPVTIGEYLRFCEDTGKHWPEWLEEGSQYHIETGSDHLYRKRGVSREAVSLPVVGISWEDTQAYCDWLGAQTGEVYGLPTEAEWEQACRAGGTTRYCFGDEEKGLGEYAWFSKNAEGKLHPVGEKRPNDWGLADMHGNVWEWVNDWYAAKYYEQLAAATRSAASGAERAASGGERAASGNPTGPESGSPRVVRGGSWLDGAVDCRSAYRDWVVPGYRLNFLGFRLSRKV